MRFRDDVVEIGVILLFIIGFSILVSYDTNITGFTGFEFGVEAVSFGTGNAANWPYNMSGAASVINRWQDTNRQVNFTYNVSADNNDYINNCTLWMDIDDAGYEANETLNRSAITAVVNQTINETFQSGIHEIIWKVGCYDNASDQTNTSARRLSINYLVTESKPNIGAHAWYDRNYVVMQHRFEEFNGSDYYDETGLNNGTAVGGVKWCPDGGDSQKWNCSGRVGKGVHFDGAGDYINVSGTSFDGTGDLTVSLWVNFKEVGVGDRIIDNGQFYIGLNNIIGLKWFQISSDGGTTHAAPSMSNILSLNKWHHIVVVRPSNGDNVKLYRDGEDVTNTANSGTPAASTELYMGNSAALTNGLNASIDEVTIWNRSLSAIEVAQLYYSSAVSYNSTFTIQDISTSNNNTADEDNDTIKFIYDWYVNNESMAVLNMPFEAVNNGSEMNFSKDYSDNENHGSTTCFNGVVFDGTSGWNRTGGYDGFGAYHFDGSDYLDLGSNTLFDSTQPLTVSFWSYLNGYGSFIADTMLPGVINLKTDQTTSFVIFYGASGGSYAGINFGSNSNFLELKTSTDVSSDLIGTWKHVALVFDGVDRTASSSYSLYLNGISQSLDASGGFMALGNANYIGKGDCSYTYFNGTIDEVLIFNRSLSAEQIKALYYNQTQTIKSSETVKGESWKAEVTANDGYGDSIVYNTSEIIIDDVTLKVGLQAPVNYYNTTDKSISFTYNVTDLDSIAGVINCSLWLYESNTWTLNSTEDYPEVNIDQTFNLTFDSDGSRNWTVACYDKEHEQTNSSNYKFTISSIPEEGGFSPNLRNIKSSYLESGIPKVIEFNLPGLPVISVIVTLGRSALLDLSAGILLESFVEDKLDDAYAYFELSSNLNNDYFSGILINFKVKKDYENIRFYQLGDEWNKLGIIQIYEDSKYKYYQTSVSGLGYFAVSGEQVEVEKQETVPVKSEAKEKEPKAQVVKSRINWNSFLGSFLLLNLVVMTFLFYKDRMFSRRIKIFGSISFSLLVLFLFSNVNITGFGVYTAGSGSFIGILSFVILVVVVAIIGLIYLIVKSRGKEETPVDEEVRFKLLAKQIIDKLKNNRISEVEEDYKKLINLYKKLVEGVELDERRELYSIIEDVYEKYYSGVMKERRKFR